jgi:hypothetical protein
MPRPTLSSFRFARVGAQARAMLHWLLVGESDSQLSAWSDFRKDDAEAET